MAELTPIYQIQGAGAASPLIDQKVITWGVVTGVTSDGFYLQDPVGDGDPATSDGIYAFSYDPPSVKVGECVQVAGEVTEFYAKTELEWLTAITPAAACGTGEVTPLLLPLVRPGDDPAATLEPLEGMVVQLEPMTAFVHGATKRFAGGEMEIAVVPAQWQRYFGPVHLFHDQAANSALLFLNNRLGATLPLVQWGDLLHIGSNGPDDNGPQERGLVGVLDYNFGKYQLLPLPDQILTVGAGAAREQTLPLPPLRFDEFGICSYNLHGLGRGTAQFPNATEYEAALRARASVIARQLTGCTVIGLQETGSPEDARALAEVLTTEHALAYRPLAIEGPASYEAEFPLTNSMLVDSTRVMVEALDTIVGCAGQDYGIEAPGVCPVGAYPLFDRPPLVAKLAISAPPGAPTQSVATVWVINNHWKSKSGNENANARLRAAQAAAVAERVQAILVVEPNAQIVVLGDLNDFYRGEAVAALQNATGLFHPFEWLPPLDRYTYIFNGAAQVLDHLLVTPNLASQLALVQILHIHADAAAGEMPLAHSDHDPVVVRVRPGGAAVVGGMMRWGQIAVSARESSGAMLAQAMTNAQGDFRLWGLPPGTVTLHYSAPEWILLDAEPQQLEVTEGMVTPIEPQARHTTAIIGAWVALSTPRLADLLIP